MTDAKTPEQLFAEALVKFQADLPSIGKDSRAEVPTKNGGKYTYNYAALPDLLAAVLPKLTEHGLSFTATPDLTEHGFVLRYALLHVGGHREAGAYPLPNPAQSTPQQIGSSITYGRRYCFTAATGIAPDEDDDGQAAADARSEPLPRDTRRRGATTRHSGPDDPTTHVDEWTTDPVFTDGEWRMDWERRLTAATNAVEIDALDAEARRKWSDKRVANEDVPVLERLLNDRREELKPAAVAS